MKLRHFNGYCPDYKVTRKRQAHDAVSKGKEKEMEGETKLSNEILARAARLCESIGCNDDCPLQKEEASNCFSSRRYCLQRVRYLDRYVEYLQGKLDKAGIAYMTELDMDKIFKKDSVEVE
jgi:hypothetical protein